MGSKIKFTRNYSDLSTTRGFQFEFYCDKCGSGYRTSFKPSAVGTVSEVLDAASSIFGGLFSKSSEIGNRVNTTAWEKAHDQAFQAASEEMKGEFIQCPRCSNWVCKEKCWNKAKGLCKDCAPDLGVEMSAAQSSKSVEEIWAHAHMADEDRKLSKENWEESIRASCPNCGKPLEKNARFCPDCGASLINKKCCSKCGEKQNENSKFCSNCGSAL